MSTVRQHSPAMSTVNPAVSIVINTTLVNPAVSIVRLHNPAMSTVKQHNPMMSIVNPAMSTVRLQRVFLLVQPTVIILGEYCL